MIGDRVKHARLYHGWTGTELAERVGSSQPKISQLERGEYTSNDLIGAIADVTGFSRWWFDLGPLPDLPKGSLKFRKLASSSARDDERVRAHVRQAIEVIDRFGNRRETPTVRIEPCAPDSVTSIDDIEDVALETRELLGVGPIDRIPNLVRAVERAGVVVIGSVVEIQRHDGASYWPDYPFGRPIICVSRGVPGDRQRFSVAHELGHLVLHQFRNLEPADAEHEAHRFAGSLLVPAAAVRDEVRPPVTLRSLAFVKAKWGISIRALIRRSLDLQIIDAAKRVSLERQISARGWNKGGEPVDVPYEHPKLLRRLIEVATPPTGKIHDATGLPPLAGRDLLA